MQKEKRRLISHVTVFTRIALSDNGEIVVIYQYDLEHLDRFATLFGEVYQGYSVGLASSVAVACYVHIIRLLVVERSGSSPDWQIRK